MPEPMRLLVVEDEALIALALKMDLAREGFSVCGIAARGEEAVALALELHPDLILMDVRLAGEMDGFDAAEAILAVEDIPIIFLSGYLDQATTARMKEISPYGSLSKPVMIYELRRLLAESQ